MRYIKVCFWYFSSKKDAPVRRQELISAVSEPMVKYLKNHAKELVMHSAALLVVLAIITKANCKCIFIKAFCEKLYN